MSAAGNMTMRARLQRNADLADDGFGHPEKARFLDRNTLPCRVWSKTRREINDENKLVMIEDIRGTFELGADISELDQISDVVDRRGRVLFEGPLAIIALARRKGHTEATLERFK